MFSGRDIPNGNSCLPVLTFTYHLPRPSTDRFAHVNGKQTLFCGVLRRYVSQNTVAITGKNALYLSVNVFSMEVLFGDTILTSPTGNWTAILRGHPSHAKV